MAPLSPPLPGVRTLAQALLLAAVAVFAAPAQGSLPGLDELVTARPELATSLQTELPRELPGPCEGEQCGELEAPQPETRVRGFELDLYCRLGGEQGLSCRPRQVWLEEYGEGASDRLVYAKARYFDPELGRFLSQDSYLGELTEPPSLHRYLYAFDNPTRYVDPTGHFTEEQLKRLDEIERKRGRAAAIAEATGAIVSPLRTELGASPDQSDTRNFLEEAAIGLPQAFLPMGTFEGLANQDPGQIAKGLAVEATYALGGVVIKEYGGALVNKLVEKAPVLGRDLRELGGEAFESATTFAREQLLPRLNPRNYELPKYDPSPQVSIGGVKGSLPKYVGPKQGRYEFPDQTADEIPYVGQSKNIPRRLKTHERAGRLKPGTETTTEVLGGKTAREIAEHQRIQQLTEGVPASQSNNVSNKVDPIGPNRRHLLDEDPKK